MILKALTVLLLFCSSVVAQTDAELFDVLTSNRESIECYAAELTESASDRSVITGWIDAQPLVVSGPIRDRLNDRRERERTPEETEELRRWRPDRPTIWEGRQVIREGRAKGAFWGRIIFWTFLGTSILIGTVMVIRRVFK